MRLEWSPYLAVGVSVIDDQHIELFRRFNRLLDALSEGHGKNEIPEIVHFLEDYVVTHFGMEEKVMDTYSYSGAGAHKAQHAWFTMEIKSLRKELLASHYAIPPALELASALGEWLVNHVSNTDRALGQFLRVAMATRRAA